MICTKCGAEVADGMRFCTSCGTPIVAPAADNSDRTVLINESMDMSVQPNNNPLGQVAQNTQYTGQPQMAPGMNTPYAGQPQMAPGMNTQYTGQPQMTQGMYTQQPYGQPNMMYNQQPKPPKQPRKPLSPNAKKGLIIGGIAVVVLAVFFLVVWPILTRSKLQGEYTCRSSYSEYSIVFDNGTYAIFDEDGDGTEAGTYVLKDDKITMTSLAGYETDATFDADENTVKVKGYYSTNKYKSSDEDEKLGIKLTPTYVEDLEKRVEEAVENITDDDSYEYAYICEDDLVNGYGFEEELGKELDYANDPTLQFLLENDFMSISVDAYYGNITVDVYPWY